MPRSNPLPTTPRSPLPKRLASGLRLSREAFPVEESALENGLALYLLPNAAVPAISLHLFFRVGSRDESPGATGLAHLFEHMYFNGSARFGPGEFDRRLESMGGHSNAYTSHEMTVFHELFPSRGLERVLELEADRMASLLLTEEALARERQVVMEERRLVVENEPLGLLDEELFATAFRRHPFRNPIIGWMEDLRRLSRAECLDFFERHYAPANAALWLVGDFESSTARLLVERCFGALPARPAPGRISFQEPPAQGQREARLRLPVQCGAVMIGYRAPPADSPDAVALDLLQLALAGGEGSRLIKELVYRRRLVQSLTIDFTWRAEPGLFIVLMELSHGVSAERALRALDEQLDELLAKGLREEERARAAGQLRAASLRELATNDGRANTLGTYQLLCGDWARALELPRLYAEVNRASLREVARRYLSPEGRTVAILEPSAEGRGEGRASHGRL